MTDSNEKGSIDRSDIARQDPEGQEPHYERPTGLKGLYYSTVTQTAMVGFVCFMCPGLFNALNGLGGGGQMSATTSANANSALYATFAFFAFFAGYVCFSLQLVAGTNCHVFLSSINNVLGSKLTLQIGSCGYGLYIGSFLYVSPVIVTVFHSD